MRRWATGCGGAARLASGRRPHGHSHAGARRYRRDGALRAADDPLDVLVLTTFGEDEVLWGAIEAGASGFVLKDSSAEELIAAVRAVAGGGAWFDPAVAPRLLDRYRERWRRQPVTRLGSSSSPSASTRSCG